MADWTTRTQDKLLKAIMDEVRRLGHRPGSGEFAQQVQQRQAAMLDDYMRRFHQPTAPSTAPYNPGRFSPVGQGDLMREFMTRRGVPTGSPFNPAVVDRFFGTTTPQGAPVRNFPPGWGSRLPAVVGTPTLQPPPDELRQFKHLQSKAFQQAAQQATQQATQAAESARLTQRLVSEMYPKELTVRPQGTMVPARPLPNFTLGEGGPPSGPSRPVSGSHLPIRSMGRMGGLGGIPPVGVGGLISIDADGQKVPLDDIPPPNANEMIREGLQNLPNVNPVGHLNRLPNVNDGLSYLIDALPTDDIGQYAQELADKPAGQSTMETLRGVGDRSLLANAARAPLTLAELQGSLVRDASKGIAPLFSAILDNERTADLPSDIVQAFSGGGGGGGDVNGGSGLPGAPVEGFVEFDQDSIQGTPISSIEEQFTEALPNSIPNRDPVLQSNVAPEVKGEVPSLLSLPAKPTTQSPSSLDRIVHNVRTDPNTQLGLFSTIARGIGDFVHNKAQAKADKGTRQDIARSNLVNALSAGKIRPQVAPKQGRSRVGGLLDFGANIADTTRQGLALSEAEERATDKTAFDRKTTLRELELKEEELARLTEEGRWNYELGKQRLDIAELKALTAATDNDEIANIKALRVDMDSLMDTFNSIRDLHREGAWPVFGPLSLDLEDSSILQALMPGYAADQAFFNTSAGSMLGSIKKVFGEDRLTNEDRRFILSKMPRYNDSNEVVDAKIRAIEGRLLSVILRTSQQAGIKSGGGNDLNAPQAQGGGDISSLSDQDITQRAANGDEAAIDEFERRGL